MAKSNNSTLKSSEPETALSILCHFLYSNFGRKLLQKKKFRIFFNKNIYNTRYEKILKMANMRLLPEEYFLSIYLTLIFNFVFVFLATIIVLFYKPPFAFIVFNAGILILSLLGIFLYNYPVILSKNRGDEIDAAMPYFLPYVKILSKELNLSKIVGLIDDFLIYKEIKAEFKRIKYFSSFLGYDIHSSIREAMQSCPSRQLSDLMNDLVTISNSGGNIYNYLERKLNNLNEEINAIEKKNLDTLLIFSQIYVVLLLIAPLFFTIMSSILNIVSGDLGGGDSSNSFFLVMTLLFFLPFVYTGFMLLVYYSKPLYARLRPITKK